MNLLLDTHVFLWWIADEPGLSPRAREAIENGENRLFLSVASAWEIAMKQSLGRLHLDDDLGRFLLDQLSYNAVEVLPVHLTHATQVARLPPIHRDPFDRLLIAQSQVEHLPILTGDSLIARYAVEVVW